MFPTPANIDWSINASPTDLRDAVNFSHSVSAHASSRSGSCPSATRFASNPDSSMRSTTIALSIATRPWPSSLRRVVGVAAGGSDAACTLKRPLMPKCTCIT